MTVYQARLAYDQTRQLLTQYRALAITYAELHAFVAALHAELAEAGIQLALPLPGQVKLPAALTEPAPAKRGSKPAAAV